MLQKNKTTRVALRFIAVFFLATGILFGIFLWRVQVPVPKLESNKTVDSYKRIKVGVDHYRVDNCWLRKNRYGVWEMYLEGSPYERGLVYGILAKELMEKQEVFFVDQIKEMVPNPFFLQILKGFVAWFNRDIYKYIPDENLQEIYGVSQSFSDKFNYIAPKYYRILNYHAAHDIGHALTDLNMVGCTSFAVSNSLSKDSSLLIARNFDFYMGDGFAEDKLVVFIKPDQGYSFASYAWAGLTGVVSGMNEVGITVTLNASKSDIPYSAKEPISLLARQILQYAGTIEEAKAIASGSETFVSESLLIGSARDGSAAVIEKSPRKMDLFRPNRDLLVCANHYQGDSFVNDAENIDNIKNSDSKYRFDRMSELISNGYPLDEKSAVEILRDKNGLRGKFIGYGNPKSLNQLIAHHGVVFKPAENKMWISTPPYQLGAFLCYDLELVFQNTQTFGGIDSLAIEPDVFLESTDYKRYEAYKVTKQRISKLVMLDIPFELSEKEEANFVANNPQSYVTYLSLGHYYQKVENYKKSYTYYMESLNRDVASQSERELILSKARDVEKHIHP